MSLIWLPALAEDYPSGKNYPNQTQLKTKPAEDYSLKNVLVKDPQIYSDYISGLFFQEKENFPRKSEMIFKAETVCFLQQKNSAVENWKESKLSQSRSERK